MRFFTTVVTLLSFFASALSAPTVVTYPGAPSDRFLVKVKDGASKDDLISKIADAGGQVTQNWHIVNGLAGNFGPNVLEIIRQHPDVEAITEDGTATTLTFRTQDNAPWGLQRISHKGRLPEGSDPKLLTYTYTYHEGPGEGVDIYIVDTGVHTTHETFGGRAVWGKTFGGYQDRDGNGHGTHVAGTAAGSQYGVAKGAKIIAVKVMSDDGSGAYSDIIDGLQWVQDRAHETGRPSVINMSIGGPANTMLDSAVRSLTTNGVHVAVAAGNSDEPADGTSPAREPSACTVGASDINDARASFSNWGRPVDIFAPGVNVTSAWIDSDSATNTISGTSMATPHMTGLIAYLVNIVGDVSPSQMVNEIQAWAEKDKLSNMLPLTVNLLAQNRAPS